MAQPPPVVKLRRRYIPQVVYLDGLGWVLLAINKKVSTCREVPRAPKCANVPACGNETGLPPTPLRNGAPGLPPDNAMVYETRNQDDFFVMETVWTMIDPFVEDS